MRKNHSVKHKRDHEYTSEDEEKSRSLSRSESNSHHYKRKHKKHKHKGDLGDINCKNGYNESPLRNESGNIIEIHGSSSEDDGQHRTSNQEHGREDGRKIGSHRYKHHREEERKHKKRRKRSRSHSQSVSKDKEVEYTKTRHKKSRGEEERNASDSNSEYESSNDHRKRKSRDQSTNYPKENDSVQSTAGEGSYTNNFEGVRVKTEYDENEVDKVTKGSHERQMKRHQSGSDMNRRNNNNQEPSGSRSNSRRRGSKERDVHDWGGASGNKSKTSKPPGEVQKPNFGLSGKLTEDTNMYNGVVIKYSEPPEARMPKKRWRLYPFKGDQPLPPLYIHRQSAYLLGRDRKVVDMPIDHPSCSKQHAALQYRLVSYERPNGTIGKQIRLYIIDLESANGTFINNKKIEARKYVELFEKDVIKFGFSSREYVLLHEHSKDDDNPSQDDT